MSLAVVTPLGTLESGLALGDRLKALRGVLDFIRGLGIDQAELFALAKLAIELFSKGFTLDGVFAFLDALFKAIESKPALAGVTAQAIDWAAVLRFATMLFELLARFGVLEGPAPKG